MVARLPSLALLIALAAGCDSAAPITADVATLELRIVDGAEVQTIALESGDASDVVGGIGIQGQTRTLSVSVAVVETEGRNAAVTLFLPLTDEDLRSGRRYASAASTGRIDYAERDGGTRTDLQVEVAEAAVVLRSVSEQRLAGTFTATGSDDQGRTVEARGVFEGRRFDLPR